MQVPIKIRFSRKCGRCGLRYPEREPACIHCANLSDREVEALKQEIREQHASNTNLGKLFYYICALLVIGIIILALG